MYKFVLWENAQLSEGIRRIVNRAIQMQELVVHDAAKNQVVVYDLDQSYEKNLERMQVAGHTHSLLWFFGLVLISFILKISFA